MEANISTFHQLNFRNVKANTILFNYESTKPDLVSITDMKVKTFELHHQRGKLLKLIEDEEGKYYNVSKMRLELADD